MKYCFSIVLALLFLLILAKPAEATQVPCHPPVYGGGATTQQDCSRLPEATKPIPTPIPTTQPNTATNNVAPKSTTTPKGGSMFVQPTPQSKAIPDTSKGGLPVTQPQPVNQLPNSGPEMLALFALVPTGLAGYLLRKKSNLGTK